jgi:thioesterase domain-containing protein/acyl carrier protein
MQVKIRGFRIELGEIEAVLAGHPGVAHCVVTARPDRTGVQQLVAYVIAKGARPSVESLRTSLAKSLPSYMVPPHFVFLGTFPLTANNKVDVRKLPDPSEAVQPQTTASSPPTTTVELQLTALWCQVLGVDAIGTHDNFFDAGGHSLKAVELFSHIQEVFGRQLPLATLFKAPTIAELAAVIESADGKPALRSLVAIQPGGRKTPFFAVPGVGGNVLVFGKLARLLGRDQPFYGLQARGLNHGEKPFGSVEEAAQAFVGEIRAIRPHGPYFIGGTCTGGVYAYEVARQLATQGEDVSLVLMEVWPPESFRRAFHLGTIVLPARFLITKLALYVRTLASLPVRRWGEFLKSKARRTAALFESKPNEIHADGTYASARLISSTFSAVARYELRTFSGKLLNITAGKRPMTRGAKDLRKVWSERRGGTTESIVIDAEDSGRLFHSPHVERLAGAISGYLEASIRK